MRKKPGRVFLVALLFFMLVPHLSAVNEGIDFGITKTGSITFPGGVDTFTFSGSTGDGIVIRIVKTGGEIWPRITLYGSSGNELERTHGASTAEMAVTLKATGTNKILVDDGFQGKYTGDYSLFVQRVNNPGNVKPFTSGSVTLGSLEKPGFVDTYSFSGSAGDTIVTRITKTGGQIWPRITLYGPPGRELERYHGASAAEISYPLTTSGTYTLLVDDGFQGKYTGDYSLFTQLTSGTGSGVPGTPVVTATSPPVRTTTPGEGVHTTGTADTGLVNYLLPAGLGIVIIAGAVFAGKKLYGRPKTAEPAGPDSPVPVPHSYGGRHGTIDHDVIISYSTLDKPIADAICAGLEARKIPCWVAPRDILPGTNYQESIVTAIDSSKIMVLIFSSHSNNSPHVLTEVNEAMSNGIIIIPFRIEDILPSKAMKYLISGPHWLDAMTPPLEKHIRELEDTIVILLENERKKQKNT